MKLAICAGLLSALWGVLPAGAAQVVYNGLGGTPITSYLEPDVASPAFGDALHLTESGTLTTVGLTLVSGGGGVITSGTMLVQFFDNTTPYSTGAVTNPLLGSGLVTLDFSARGGLASGLSETTLLDFSALNIHLPQNVLVVQQFTQTAGTSTSNGVLVTADPTVGTSLPTVFVSSGQTPPGLYTFPGAQADHFGYYLEVNADPVPEPATVGVLLAGVVGACLRRGRRGAGQRKSAGH